MQPPTSPSSDRPFLRGIVPPLVTPLKGRDQLDVEGLGRLIEHVIAGGVDGLFVLGTTGELAGLSPRLRREVITRVGKLVRGRVPFVVGATDTNLAESLALGAHAMVAGAAAVVVTVPYYLPPSQDELEEYVRTVAREQPLPVMLYNMPILTKVAFEVETVRRLADVDKVIGIKDSSGELEYLREVARVAAARTDWSLLAGRESLLVPAVRGGVHGSVPGGANVAPRLFADLYAAVVAHDEPRVAKLEERVRRLGGIYGSAGPRVPAVIRGIKGALALMGVCGERMAEPFRSVTIDEREQIRRVLAELDSQV
jgi:dihydrodipicolinate synthase/N-acetylneuraminate lyase